jgi:CheY-like chemotaxis protein
MTLASNSLVLIVDDDPLQVEIVREHMIDRGISRIVTASNGQEAIRAIEADALLPDLIVCDIHMPDVDGIEFLDYLGIASSAAKIIVVSGAESLQVKSAGILSRRNGLNFIGALQKPLDLAAFSKMLDDV